MVLADPAGVVAAEALHDGSHDEHNQYLSRLCLATLTIGELHWNECSLWYLSPYPQRCRPLMERELDNKKTQSLVAITLCMSILIASLAMLVAR